MPSTMEKLNTEDGQLFIKVCFLFPPDSESLGPSRIFFLHPPLSYGDMDIAN